MNSILYALRDTKKLGTFLFFYWLISPLVFLFYQYAVTQSSGVELREMLNQPSIALAFLIACMSLIMAGLLRGAEKENEHTEKVFGLFAIVQQLLTGNIPGFLLAYFYTRSLWNAPPDSLAPRLRWVMFPAMVLLALLSLLTLIANFNLIIP